MIIQQTHILLVIKLEKMLSKLKNCVLNWWHMFAVMINCNFN